MERRLADVRKVRVVLNRGAAGKQHSVLFDGGKTVANDPGRLYGLWPSCGSGPVPGGRRLLPVTASIGGVNTSKNPTHTATHAGKKEGRGGTLKSFLTC